MALGSLQESFPDAALIRLRYSDAVTHVYGVAVATAHVLIGSSASARRGSCLRTGGLPTSIS